MYVMSQVRPRRIFQQLKKPMAFGLDFEIGQLQLWHNNLSRISLPGHWWFSVSARRTKMLEVLWEISEGLKRSQGRTEGAQFSRRQITGGAEKSQQCRKYFQYSTLAPETL